MSSTISHTPFSIPLFAQLVRRLRLTNMRYNQIAYQCRHSYRPRYHAKQRAYQVGLRIDTSKARTAWPEDEVQLSVSVSAASTQSLHVLDETTGSPTWVATEMATETTGDDLPNPWPEADVVVQKQPATCLSPLGLVLRNIDDVDTCDLPFWGPVPGAPRWRSRPLPEDEHDHGTERMTKEPASRTYDRVWRGVMSVHVVNSVARSVDVVYGGLGSRMPVQCLKRKLRDDDVDAMVSRRPGVGVPDDGFLGAWWSEAQRGLGGH